MLTSVILIEFAAILQYKQSQHGNHKMFSLHKPMLFNVTIGKIMVIFFFDKQGFNNDTKRKAVYGYNKKKRLH